MRRSRSWLWKREVSLVHKRLTGAYTWAISGVAGAIAIGFVDESRFWSLAIDGDDGEQKIDKTVLLWVLEA